MQIGSDEVVPGTSTLLISTVSNWLAQLGSAGNVPVTLRSCKSTANVLSLARKTNVLFLPILQDTENPTPLN